MRGRWRRRRRMRCFCGRSKLLPYLSPLCGPPSSRALSPFAALTVHRTVIHYRETRRRRLLIRFSIKNSQLRCSVLFNAPYFLDIEADIFLLKLGIGIYDAYLHSAFKQHIS